MLGSLPSLLEIPISVRAAVVNFRWLQCSPGTTNIAGKTRPLIGSLKTDASGRTRFGDFEPVETSPSHLQLPVAAGIPPM